MKRRLFTILSLLVFVATVVLCVRSYWVSDHLSLIAEHGCDFGSYRGRVRFLVGGEMVHDGKVGFEVDQTGIAQAVQDVDPAMPPSPRAKIGWQYLRYAYDDEWVAETYWDLGYTIQQSRHSLLGFAFVQCDGEAMSLAGNGELYLTAPFLWAGPFWQVIVPCWAIAVVSAILPIVWLSRAWRRCNRRVPGRCAKCGYDLTANVSGVCPECGEKIERVSAAGTFS